MAYLNNVPSKRFLTLNIVLLLLVAAFGVFNYTNILQNSSLDYDEPEKPLSIMYGPEGSLYTDLKPNYSQVTDEGEQGQIEAYKIDTNEIGARDTPISEKNWHDNYSIVAIGDSFTFGWGVNKSERYTEVAEQKMEVQGLETEFMNLGIPGTGIKDHYLTFEEKALDLNPSMVLIGIRYENIRSQSESERFRQKAEERIPETEENREEKVLEERRELKQQYLVETSPEDSPLAEYMKKIDEIGEKEDIEVVYFRIEDTGDREHEDFFYNWARENSLNVIEAPKDINSLNTDLTIGDRIINGQSVDGHYNEQGHYKLGDKLSEKLPEYIEE